MADETFAPTERTVVKRHAERGIYDRGTIDAILDEALYCHVAYAAKGHARAIPTIHARVRDTIYLHGSQASDTLRSLRDGTEVCVVATLLDGLVLARSGKYHSVNYRSVVAYGTVREVTDLEEKRTALRALVDHVVPGRSADVREPTDLELSDTMVLALPLEEASAKVRAGPPQDREEDLELPIWAGVLPLSLRPGRPIDDPRLSPGLVPPPNVTHYRRPASPG